MINKIFKLFVANLLLATSVLGFDMSTISSLNIPEGEVAQIKIGDNVIWPGIPYVKYGLVAMWDGEWNTGIGLHSDSTTVWKDLVGNRDATLTGSNYWSDNSWNVYSVSNQGLATWNALDLPETQTWQFTLQTKNVQSSLGRIISPAPNVVTFGCSGSNPNTLYWYGYKRSTGSQSFTINDVNLRDLHQFTITHLANDTNVYFYVDGSLKLIITSATDNATGTDYGYFANWNSGNLTRGIDADYYSVRLYDRVLTEDEILQNAIVDRDRFGILLNP